MLRLLTDSFPGDAALDTAVSRALMLRVAAGELPETLRISRPGPIVAFGKRDVVCEGYPQAVRAARSAGYAAIERLAGGRAAVFHEQTIALAHAVPDPDPRARVDERFEATAALVARALGRLGVDARVGEVPGEYCPGAHSVNAGGERKLMGVGQRLVAGGAHVGGVVVAGGADRVRGVLVPVYAALGLAWRPETTGSVADEVGGVGWEEVTEAITAEYARLHTLAPERLDPGTLALARTLAPEHSSPPTGNALGGPPARRAERDYDGGMEDVPAVWTVSPGAERSEVDDLLARLCAELGIDVPEIKNDMVLLPADYPRVARTLGRVEPGWEERGLLIPPVA